MACAVTNNVAILCDDDSANAGTQNIYLAYSEELTVEPTLGATEHTVTGVTLPLLLISLSFKVDSKLRILLTK